MYFTRKSRFTWQNRKIWTKLVWFLRLSSKNQQIRQDKHKSPLAPPIPWNSELYRSQVKRCHWSPCDKWRLCVHLLNVCVCERPQSPAQMVGEGKDERTTCSKASWSKYWEWLQADYGKTEHMHTWIVIKTTENNPEGSCSNAGIAGFGHSQLPHCCEKGIENRFPVNVFSTVIALGSKNLLSVRKTHKTFNKWWKAYLPLAQKQISLQEGVAYWKSPRK